MNSEINQVPEPNNRDFSSEETIETLEDVELLSEVDSRANSQSPSDIWWEDSQTPIDVESEAIEEKPKTPLNLDELNTQLPTTPEAIEEKPETPLNLDELNTQLPTTPEAIEEKPKTPLNLDELNTQLPTTPEAIEEKPETPLNLDELNTQLPTTPEIVEGDLLPQSNATEAESELFTERWLDEPKIDSEITKSSSSEQLIASLADLERQKTRLIAEIQDIKLEKEQLLLQQAKDVRETMGKMVEEGMKELKERKNILQIDIEKLERRRERISQEMRTNFAGVSQDLAVRVQGFKEYLVGSLQDLAIAAEQLELSRIETATSSEKRERKEKIDNRERVTESAFQPLQLQFTEQAFAQQTKIIRQLLDRYRTRPDYYGAPWQLRRTFEPIHAEKVQKWFFDRGGRGAIDSMNSRLQNILIASAIISILHELYRDRFRTLVLIDTPEKLGEWRRGLQDCLGISRTDFGTDRGVVLFDSAEVLIQRADRSIQDKLIPLIIIDETEELVNLGLLKFPLLLAFASAPRSNSPSYMY
jgi:hypothetical protein